MKKIHLDLVTRPRENLMDLSNNLADIKTGKLVLPDVKKESIVTLVNETEHSVKLCDMLGVDVGYEISTISKNLSGKHSALVAKNIANDLRAASVFEQINQNTIVDIPARNTSIAFDDVGTIIESNRSILLGQNAMQYLAANISQDIGLVMLEQGKPIYQADISRYEKTPKDLVTGKDNKIGLDLLEFHSKAKTYGYILPTILGDMITCMAEGQLDLLTVDLLGSNTYRVDASLISNQHNWMDVRRFERDYATPILANGELEGIIVYTDVWFQEINEKSPLEGGAHLNIGTEIHKYRIKETLEGDLK